MLFKALLMGLVIMVSGNQGSQTLSRENVQDMFDLAHRKMDQLFPEDFNYMPKQEMFRNIRTLRNNGADTNGLRAYIQNRILHLENDVYLPTNDNFDIWGGK